MLTEKDIPEFYNSCPPHCTGLWQNLSDTHCRYELDKEDIECPIRENNIGKTSQQNG